MKTYRRISQYAFLILGLSLTSSAVHAGSLNFPANAPNSNGRICNVTQIQDEEGILGSLRRALNQGYHIQTPAFCSEKISFEVGGTIFLKQAIVLDKTSTNGFTLEKPGNSDTSTNPSDRLVLDASGLRDTACAITINAANITLRNITIRGLSGDGAGICLEANARQTNLDRVTVAGNGIGVWMKAGAQGNTLRNGSIRDNRGIGVRLDSALQNQVTLNGIYRNQQELSSPLENIKPTLTFASPVDPANAISFNLNGTLPNPVERIEIFRSVPSPVDAPSNWIKTLTTADLTGLAFSTTVAASNGERIFAIAIANDGSTSAMSNVLLLDSAAGSNSSGTRQCSPGIMYQAYVDFDRDGLPDYLEDKNKNCRVDNDETDPARADSDGDLIPDGIEDFDRDGVKGAGESDPRLTDTDGDGISDGMEDNGPGEQARNGRFEFGELNPNSPDTDSDGLLDRVEDADRNGQFDAGETKGFLADTDLDGLGDGAEDVNHNGTVDMNETDPRINDTDNDTILDGDDRCPRNPNLLCQVPCVVGAIPPETLDADLDNIPDASEDFNHNCVLDAGETNPYEQDTDGDGRIDSNDSCPRNVDDACTSACVAGAFVPPNRDSDSDGLPDVREDVNRNCRVDANESDPFDSNSDNDASLDGADSCPLDPNPLCSVTCVAGQTPAVTLDSDGDGIPDVYEDLNHNCALDGNETDFRQRDTDHDGFLDPQDACPNNGDTTCASSCVQGQFVPPTRDSDRDGIPDAIEDSNNNCMRDITETSAWLADTDEDGTPDGNEDKNHNGIVDAGETSPLLTDSDQDGILDGLEDRNHNGVVDFGESNPTAADSDQDGVPDRIEDANLNGVLDRGETSAYLADSDQDGAKDGDEDKNKNGRVDAGETDPRNADTDGDGANDSQEIAQGTNPLISRESDFRQASGQGGCALQMNGGNLSFASSLAWMLSSFGILALVRKKKA